MGAISFGAIALSDELWVVALALATYIAHSVIWNVMAASVRQKVVATDMMGRVGSVGRLVSVGGLAAGAGLGGVLARYLGYQAPFAVAVGLFILCIVVVLLARGQFRSFESDDEQTEREDA